MQATVDSSDMKNTKNGDNFCVSFDKNQLLLKKIKKKKI